MDQAPKKNTSALQKQYQQRITLAKHGQEAYQKADYKNAIKFYNQYLKVLSDINGIEVTSLSPKYFDRATQSSEMFLISQIYWDFTKIYDLSPQLRGEFLFSLNQFANFSLNNSFQVVNAETLRRFIRKGRCKNIGDFKAAYQKIYITSKMCFVATYAFGETHPTTDHLRQFKRSLSDLPCGEAFIRNYYRFSPSLVQFCQNYPFIGKNLRLLFFRPALSLFSKIYLRLIIK